MNKTIACVLLAFVTACSGSDGPTEPGNNGGNGGNNGGNNNPPPNAVTVTMGPASFSPATATVAVNGTVTWTNDSGVAHTITPTGHSQWTKVTTSAADGQALQVTFPTAGTFSYNCEFHSGMNGSITVQ